MSAAERGKRVHPVKLLLSDDEMLDASRQAAAQDLPIADVIRRGWLQSIYGTLGLAIRRAKQSRGSDEELHARDFEPSAFDRSGAL
jgi:hypothetical protein